MATDYDELRRAVLAATLHEVPFDGWTDTALRRGVATGGYPPEAAIQAFPGGIGEVIAFHVAEADRRMLAALETMDLESMRVRERIAVAVRTRLEQNAGEREAIRRALQWFALPAHAPQALRSLYATVDAIWYAAGDRSTDFNFYTKRALLAGVYGATLLYWLNDRSEGFVDSWAFLDRRIDDVLRAGKATGQMRQCATRLPNPFLVLRDAMAGGRPFGHNPFARGPFAGNPFRSNPFDHGHADVNGSRGGAPGSDGRHTA